MKIENYKLKIVFFGTPSFVVPVLETLAEKFDLVGVVTTPDTVQGRKKLLTPTPVKTAYQKCLEQTQKKGMIITPATLNETIHKVLQELRPDLFVVAAYGMIIPENMLTIPTYGAINIHPSLLPKYRGPSPIQTALLNGDTKSGITIIKMDEEIDHGPILTVKEMYLTDKDTFESLHISMFIEAAMMLPETIADFVAGRIKPKEQDHKKATFTRHITKQDGFIDISKTESMSPLEIGNWKLEIARKVRAYYPWPTAWTKIRIKNKELRIIKFLPDKNVQLEGGKPMTLKEFTNGYPELADTLQKILP
jgi:methionyl-tRNA formyltransferase